MVFSRDLPHSFSEALRVAREILASNHRLVTQARVETESELIVTGAHRLATGENLSRSDLYFRMNDRIPEASGEKVLILSLKRAEGKPLQYVLGYTTFLNHEYQVNPNVLIPRPETEVLVTEALKILGPAKPALGLEVGLGSGIISIELLATITDLKMVATEISLSATQVVQLNASSILSEEASGQPSRLSILKPDSGLDVMKPFIDGKIHGADFLISNPPYLDRNQKEFDQDVLESEPENALFPEGSDPLYFYKEIARHAPQVLKRGAYVFLEIASERAELTRAIFNADQWETTLAKDLNQRDRVLVSRLK
jgi:release factor glutamine methyltransferase